MIPSFALIKLSRVSSAAIAAMSDVRVLDNSTIHDLLINLSKEETLRFRHIVEKTFEDFSTVGERQYQPGPSVINRPNGQNSLFRPFTSDSGIGAKIMVEPAPGPDGKRDPLHGVVVVCDGKGNPNGILSAEEVTGYRTTMNVMVPFFWRKHVENIVIFGTGLQALWHTRLILALRGPEVKSITYVKPGKNQVDQLTATVSEENRTRWQADCSFHFIDTTTFGSLQQLESCLICADCIFCTTPSKKPLFSAGYLTKRTSRRPFISAIGSWQPDMIELDPSILDFAIADKAGYNPVTGESKGLVLVDDREFALTNSGELVQSRIEARDVVEIGEIIALKNGKGIRNSLAKADIEITERFFSEGFVVYKSVGLSLTDLTVSDAILVLSRERQQAL